jgi:hypothetical protein
MTGAEPAPPRAWGERGEALQRAPAARWRLAKREGRCSCGGGGGGGGVRRVGLGRGARRRGGRECVRPLARVDAASASVIGRPPACHALSVRCSEQSAVDLARPERTRRRTDGSICPRGGAGAARPVAPAASRRTV